MAAWWSILPASISFIEIWIVRLFLFLGIITIGPWIAVLLYDALLYIFRTITYDLPWVGGRARNRPRPRAPSLTARPSGKRRSLSLPIPPPGNLEPNDHSRGILRNRPNSSNQDTTGSGTSTGQ